MMFSWRWICQALGRSIRQVTESNVHGQVSSLQHKDRKITPLPQRYEVLAPEEGFFYGRVLSGQGVCWDPPLQEEGGWLGPLFPCTEEPKILGGTKPEFSAVCLFLLTESSQKHTRNYYYYYYLYQCKAWDFLLGFRGSQTFPSGVKGWR